MTSIEQVKGHLAKGINLLDSGSFAAAQEKLSPDMYLEGIAKLGEAITLLSGYNANVHEGGDALYAGMDGNTSILQGLLLVRAATHGSEDAHGQAANAATREGNAVQQISRVGMISERLGEMLAMLGQAQDIGDHIQDAVTAAHEAQGIIEQGRVHAMEEAKIFQNQM